MTYAWFSLLKLAQDYDNINYASNAVDRGLSPDGVKPKTIRLEFVASPLSTQH